MSDGDISIYVLPPMVGIIVYLSVTSVKPVTMGNSSPSKGFIPASFF